MSKLQDAQARSVLISERIRQRTDLTLRQQILSFEDELLFLPLCELAISPDAWNHVVDAGIDPRLVFAHPRLLRQHPEVSEYYRGIALLPRKRVADIAASVDSWERGTRTTPINYGQSIQVAQLYNAVISSVIEGSSNWTIENGYRNIIANIGIGLDGTMRNVIGQDAENLVKIRIKEWLQDEQLILSGNREGTQFSLPNGYSMYYRSEPDIEFRHTAQCSSSIVATIEIKGGKDPAGALERLGAIHKSFEATPPGCTNILVAGIFTHEMRERLDEAGITKTFLLDDLIRGGRPWIAFLNEVFHYTVRITDKLF